MWTLIVNIVICELEKNSVEITGQGNEVLSRDCHVEKDCLTYAYIPVRTDVVIQIITCQKYVLHVTGGTGKP